MHRTARWVTGSLLRDSWLFIFIWIWMTQLLLPFGEATGIPEMAPFLLFLGLLFLVDLAVGNTFGRFALKAILMSLFAYGLYYTQYAVYELMWMKHWITDLSYTVRLAFTAKQGDLLMLPESARTTGFLVALWMFQSLYRQSLGRRFWMFLFLIVGSVLLGVLDVFFVEDASGNIMLFLLLGLVVLGFMQLPMIERIARMPRRMRGWPAIWLVWTLVLSIVVVSVSAVIPKKETPTWSDPVAFLQNKYGDGTGGRQKIGYGSDDTALGGPFEMDDTEVFTVISSAETYYRGESKTSYTGKGWLSGSTSIPVEDLTDFSRMQLFEGNLEEGQEVKQTFTFQEDVMPLVFSQYRLKSIEQLGLAAGSQRVMVSSIDQRYELDTINEGDSYTVISQIPFYDEQKLRGSNIPTMTRSFTPYVQVPATLPERVVDLAREITQNAKTPYERAQALEQYLRSNYNYQIEGVPVPKENQDFVDQFLFETKFGYCDHFSSSMVVMARTLGIPARWVKGFTKGDVDLTYRGESDEEYKYIVRNRNAHSWPELYFEGAGWVAFEPTSTFTMPHVFKPEQEAVAPIPVPEVDSVKKEQEEEEETATNGGFSLDIDWKAVGNVLLFALIAGLIAAFIFRRNLLIAYYLRRGYDDDDAVMNALARLFIIMHKLGWKRDSDMTLREYADMLANNNLLRGREMVPLAQLSERVFYGKRTIDDKDRLQVRDLWTRIIRKAGRIKRK